MLRRSGRLCVVALFVALAPPVSAADPDFELSVDVGETYTDHVGYATDAEDSDVVTKVRVDLPFKGESPTRTWELVYRPSYYRYEEFGDLDHVEHLARFGLTSTPSTSTKHFFNVAYSSTQSQTVPLEFDSTPDFTTSRTERQTLTGTFRVKHRMRPRWSLDGSLSGRALAVEDISGFDPGPSEEQLGDRIRYGSSIGVARELSRRSSLGFGYRYTFFDLDYSTDETVHSLFTEIRTAIGSNVEFVCRSGVASRSGAENDTVDTEEVEADLALVRSFQAGALSFSGNRAVSNADAIAGGSMVNTASIRYTSTDIPRWRWSALTRYSLREPLDPTESDLRNFRGELDLTYRGPRFKTGRLQEGIGFRIRGAFVDQTGEDDESRDASYYIVNASIVAFFGV